MIHEFRGFGGPILGKQIQLVLEVVLLSLDSMELIEVQRLVLEETIKVMNI
jgi:hypothetical protein